jgi:hypothetical protein
MARWNSNSPFSYPRQSFVYTDQREYRELEGSYVWCLFIWLSEEALCIASEDTILLVIAWLEADTAVGIIFLHGFGAG